MSRLVFRCEHVHRSGFRLNAEFEAGDGVTALFGPSGSGKTTILSLIAGLLHPERGLIRFNDRALTDTTANIHLPPERRGIGFVFQDHCLFPHLTVRQNLEYGLKRQPGKTVDFAHVVEILEIGDLLDRAPRTLSGGQKQRVALGRALLRGPDLLLLDEPLTALDEPLQDRIIAFLKRVLSEYELPTILVTHDPAHVRELAGKVIEISNGAIVANPRHEVHHGDTEPRRQPGK